MRRKTEGNLVLLVLLCSFFIVLGIRRITDRSELQRLNSTTHTTHEFRRHILNERLFPLLEDKGKRAEIVGLYLLESKFSYQKLKGNFSEETFDFLNKKWSGEREWRRYKSVCQAIWGDLKYFPVPQSSTNEKLTVTYRDSWMNERTYGGKRGHEGTDIMAGKNVAGLYPVVSMTDGTVTSKGWLPKGGYRIGVTAPSGGYFYYAHLESYGNLEMGEKVKAGDVLGYMGNTGYGDEGTRGKFPVHLHVGVYIYEGEKEISINPYWLLKFLENHKLKYAYS